MAGVGTGDWGFVVPDPVDGLAVPKVESTIQLKPAERRQIPYLRYRNDFKQPKPGVSVVDSAADCQPQTLKDDHPNLPFDSIVWPWKCYLGTMIQSFQILMKHADEIVDGKRSVEDRFPLLQIPAAVIRKLHPNAKRAGTAHDPRAVAIHNVISDAMQNYFKCFLEQSYVIDEDGVPLTRFDYTEAYKVIIAAIEKALQIKGPTIELEERRCRIQTELEKFRVYASDPDMICTIEQETETRLLISQLYGKAMEYQSESATLERALKEKFVAEGVEKIKKQRAEMEASLVADLLTELNALKEGEVGHDVLLADDGTPVSAKDAAAAAQANYREEQILTEAAMILARKQGQAAL